MLKNKNTDKLELSKKKNRYAWWQKLSDIMDKDTKEIKAERRERKQVKVKEKKQRKRQKDILRKKEDFSNNIELLHGQSNKRLIIKVISRMYLGVISIVCAVALTTTFVMFKQHLHESNAKYKYDMQKYCLVKGLSSRALLLRENKQGDLLPEAKMYIFSDGKYFDYVNQSAFPIKYGAYLEAQREAKEKQKEEVDRESFEK